MNIEKCKELAQKADVEIGWVWLFENGFSERVSDEVKKKIEKAKEEQL